MTHNHQFLLLIACALLAGTSHALQPESQSAASKVSDAPLNVQQTHHVVNDKKKPQPYTKTGAKPHNQQVTSEGQSTQRRSPPQSANGQSQAVSGNSASPSKPAQSRGAGIAKHAVSRTPPVGDALPVRPPVVGSPGAMSQNDTRHHGPNLSELGGVASSKAAATATINGSAAHHRP